jgi:DNA repair exonuclease SbcCD nuclease subunit
MIVKNLYVGDPHATVDSLEDVRAVLQYANSLAHSEQVDNIVILGDLFHTHQTVNLYVLNFWMEELKKITVPTSSIVWAPKVMLLVGNHDIPGKADPNVINSLKSLASIPNVQVISAPFVKQGIEYRPYMHSNTDFEALPELAPHLVAHVTVNGAQFENGFYVKPEECVNVDAMKYASIISGHIHKPGPVGGKVYYVGSSRWVTQSDANQQKYLTLVTYDGATANRVNYPLSKYATPIFVLDWTEGQDKPKMPPNGKVTLNLHGSVDWIRETSATLTNVSVRRFPKTSQSVRVSEAKGIPRAFAEYCETAPLLHTGKREAAINHIKEVLG